MFIYRCSMDSSKQTRRNKMLFKLNLLLANYYANKYGKEINLKGCTGKAKKYNKLSSYFYNKL